MPNYRELEQRLYNYTDGWTKYDGAFPVETKKDKENAEAILKNHYSKVDPNHLDYENKQIEGTDYRIEFDEALEGEDERFDSIYNSISKSIEDEDRAVEEAYKKEKKKHKPDELQFMPEFNPTLINASQQATVTNPGGAMSIGESYDLPNLETFREYCSDKFTDLGTVEYYNYSGYPDEAKVLMIVDIGDYDDVQIISDEYDALIGVKDKEIVFDTDTTDPATFALSMGFKEIDNDFYDELIENMGDMLVESLDEAAEKHSELNPDLWDDTELKPEVKEKLIEIAEKFKENLAQNNIELDIIDEVIVGSNANYNYNATSDIDLHIVADTSVYEDCRELAAKLYEAYKRLWNNKYDPTIYGHEVEIYVEPDGLKVNSNGIYSLTTGWIKAPKHEIIPDVDQSELDARVETWADKISEAETLEEIDGIIDELYIMRQQGILANGEFDLDNLTFKEIRSRGILQELRDKKVDLETEEMSL